LQILQILIQAKVINTELAIEKICQNLHVIYIEGKLEQNILKRMAEILSNLKRSPKDPLNYTDLQKKIWNDLHYLEPARFDVESEWIRVFNNQTLFFLGKDKKSLLQFSSEKAKEELESQLQDFFQQIGLYLFGNQKIFLYTIQVLLPKLQCIESNQISLKILRSIYTGLFACDANKRELIYNEVTQKLHTEFPAFRRDKKISSTVIDYLLIILRSPSTSVLNYAFSNILNDYKSVFGEDLKDDFGEFDKQLQLKSSKTQRIQTEFHDSHIKITYMKKGFIYDDFCYITQLIEVFVPNPGSPNFENPVSIQLYCEFDKDYKNNNKFMICLKRLSIFLKLKGFPQIKRIKPLIERDERS
jgi:hypothetical protein